MCLMRNAFIKTLKSINFVVEITLKNSSKLSAKSIGEGRWIITYIVLFGWIWQFCKISNISRHKLIYSIPKKTLWAFLWLFFFLFWNINLCLVTRNIRISPVVIVIFIKLCKHGYHVLYSLFIIIYVCSTSWSKEVTRRNKHSLLHIKRGLYVVNAIKTALILKKKRDCSY